MVIKKGDTVKLVDMPLELLFERTENEQNTLRVEIGSMHLIQSSILHGKIELELYNVKGIPNTIFISPSCVTRILR